MFHLTFLGTSAGIPTKQRNVTALAIECINPYLSDEKPKNKSKRPWVLVDCGEGTQQQLLHTKLSVQQLAAICITHVHGDHCYGLPGLLASMAMEGRSDKLTLIAPQAIAKFLDVLTITTELYFSYPIEFMAIEDYLAKSQPIGLKFSANHTLNINVTKLSHRVASHAFSLTQTVTSRKLQTAKLKGLGIPTGAIWGTLQRGDDVHLPPALAASANTQTLLAADFVKTLSVSTKMVVAGDNDDPSLLSDAIINASLLVHEATYTQAVADAIQARPDGFDPMHTTAKGIASFAESVNLPNLILTHFSARYQYFDDPTAASANMADIRLEAEAYYQGNLWLASDFAQFTVDDKVKKLG